MTLPLGPHEVAHRAAGVVGELGDRLRLTAARLVAAEAEIVRLREVIVQAEVCLDEALDDLAEDLPALIEQDTGHPMDDSLPSVDAALDDLRQRLDSVLEWAADERPPHLRPSLGRAQHGVAEGEGVGRVLPDPPEARAAGAVRESGSKIPQKTLQQAQPMQRRSP